MNSKRIATILLLLILTAVPVLGKDRAPLRREDYLGAAEGARPVSLGGSLAGVGGDESSLYWNPAGLNLLPVNLISINFGSEPVTGLGQLFNPSLRGRGISSLSLSTPEMALGWRALSRLNFEDSLFLQVDDGETTQVWRDMEFWLDEYVVSITTQSQKQIPATGESVLLGINIKYLRGALGIAERWQHGGAWQELEVNLDRGNGYGLDIGLLLNKPAFRVGLAGQNVLAKVYWKDYEAERIGANVTGGVSILPRNWLTLAASLEQRWDRRSSTVFHVGGEVTLWREPTSHWLGILTSFSPSIRLGLYGPNLSKEDGRVFTAGLGYIYSRCKVDTAVYGTDFDINDLRDLGYVVTLAVPF